MYASQVTVGARTAAPAVGAGAWAIVDGSTGELVAGKNARQRLAPASTTKIATAIVAIERGRLEDIVRVDVDCRQMGDSSVMGLIPGDELTLRDLLYGLMLPSGNDAAVAIARHVAGSEERFMDMVNAKFVELGLADSKFANPHGLDAEDHYSSARDLALLARYAMSNPTFAEVVSTREYTIKGKRTFTLRNGNPLLGRYAGADGVKTGYTEAALQTYVGSATKEGRRAFVAVLRSRDRVSDTIPLFDYFFENYGWRTLDLPASAINAIGPTSQSRQGLSTRPSLDVCLPKWQLPLLRWTIWLDEVGMSQTGTANSRYGSAGFYLGNRLIAELPLYGR
ncbi:MAG: D-alanyl-D-alanine carboxypeptidase family protein [Chloroflexota bacterium]